VGHIGLRDLLVRKEGVPGGELGVSGDKNRRHYGRLDAFVVVGVDANLHLLRVEGELADVERFELVVGLKIGPAPDAAVDHMRKAFPMRDLKPSVETPRDSHAFARLPRAAQRLLKRLDGAFRLFQLLDESVDRFLRPLLLLVALLPPKQLLHGGRGKGEERVEGRHDGRCVVVTSSSKVSLTLSLLSLTCLPGGGW